MNHTLPQLLLQFSLRFQMALLPLPPSKSLTATCLMPTSTTIWQVSFKVKCQVQYSIMYAFLNYLTCETKLLILLGSDPFESLLILLRVTDKVSECCASIFP